MTLGEKTQKLRKAKGWTQEDLAARIAVSRQALSRWEQGTVIPDTENVLQLSKAFGTSIDYLLIDDYESNTDIPVVHTPNKRIKSKAREIIGICVSCVGLVGFITVWILSIYFPTNYLIYVNDNLVHVYSGIWGFVIEHRLEWLCGLCVLAFITGIIIALIASKHKAEASKS